ncbi:RDD family protein [Acinetobacter sp. LoGeW2-3]|uniref:RDD family protein n=1 Tax=Acinetobacter sp. LoGeW2-3 TaxID=1808001 RepID=UPI000C058C5B|nr:RDD family protein [Acinetobacter sp. LoGeW2-3]ATO20301.1 RDD family protein [Acinetobacter sp. LoGeW2-3]
MQIYLARNNQQAGPYTLEQLNQMLASQQVLLTDLAWHQGMTEWKALGELTQGKFVYQPEGYVTPAPVAETAPFEQPVAAPTNTYARTTAKANTFELAGIPARIFAKFVDLLLWIPATFILTAFFTAEEKIRFTQLNEQIMTQAMGGNPDQNRVLELQSQMLDMFSTQAWTAAGLYLLIMLVIQGYLIAKSGQSIGKKLTKIKIVDAETGSQTSLMRAFTLRSIVFILPTIYFIPLFSLLDWIFGLGKNRQTLHDKLAKTKVIKQ